MKYRCVFLFVSVLFRGIYALTHKLTLNFTPDNIIRDEDLTDCYHKTNPTLSNKQSNVYVTVAVLDIDQITEDSMEYRLHAYVLATWTNENLELVRKNHSIPILLPPNLAKCIWQPDIIFSNSKEIISFQDTVPNKGFKILPNGELYRVERLIMRVSCPMYFKLYPMDTQYCHFKIALMNNPDEMVLLHWRGKTDSDAITYSYKIDPLQFYITEAKKYVHTVSWITGNYTELWANITFHRRMTGSVINFYVPSTLVVFLSWLSFYIDVEAAPARVSLGVTALLTITTQMIQARNILPPVQYITALDIWLFACLILVFASFIEYSIAYSFRGSINNYRTVAVSPTKQPTNLPIEKSKTITTISPEGKLSRSWTENNKSPDQTVKGCRLVNPFDKVSRWFFPLGMLIFSIVYWIYLFCKTDIEIF